MDNICPPRLGQLSVAEGVLAYNGAANSLIGLFSLLLPTKIYERADTLTDTATGLPKIASRDHDAMPVMCQKWLRISKDEFAVYVSDTEKATWFDEMELHVKNRMANIDDMNAFLYDIRTTSPNVSGLKIIGAQA